jgi:hypothetical protein
MILEHIHLDFDKSTSLSISIAHIDSYRGKSLINRPVDLVVYIPIEETIQ